jgi:hypothetical protein
MPAQAPETASPDRHDRNPRVVITSFPNYEAVGAVYLERARQEVAITPAIQALADQITSGWPKGECSRGAVSLGHTHICYVGIYLGFGVIVPHSAQKIMDARDGDCKDHIALLEALLTAKGIRKSPVLVNAGSRYWLLMLKNFRCRPNRRGKARGGIAYRDAGRKWRCEPYRRLGTGKPWDDHPLQRRTRVRSRGGSSAGPGTQDVLAGACKCLARPPPNRRWKNHISFADALIANKGIFCLIR